MARRPPNGPRHCEHSEAIPSGGSAAPGSPRRLAAPRDDTGGFHASRVGHAGGGLGRNKRFPVGTTSTRFPGESRGPPLGSTSGG